MHKYAVDLEIVKEVGGKSTTFSCCRLHKTKFIAVTEYKNKVRLYVYKLVDRTIGLSLRWTCLNVVLTVLGAVFSQSR